MNGKKEVVVVPVAPPVEEEVPAADEEFPAADEEFPAADEEFEEVHPVEE